MSRSFWQSHALVPGLTFLGAAVLLATTPLDVVIARAWAFNGSLGRFWGAGTWWAGELLHGWGGRFIRAAGGVLVLGWLASLWRPRLGPYRRPLGYVVVSALVTVALVGLMKAFSNVDCPWSLAPFGGTHPYVHLFGDRPDGLATAHCFPGGHSASAFCLFTGYFGWRDRRPAMGQALLWAALLLGGVFALGQEARGAHFLSHDLWSAAMAWFTALGIYAGPFRARLWADANSQAR